MDDQLQTPSPTPPEILIDERTAAARLSLCSRTLFTLRRRGEIPFVKIGSKTLYRPRDLQTFADSRLEVADLERFAAERVGDAK